MSKTYKNYLTKKIGRLTPKYYEAMRGGDVAKAYQISLALDDLKYRRDGGPGSGNWGHEGRPGEIGGSAKGNATTVTDKASAEKRLKEIRSELNDINSKNASLQKDLEDRDKRSFYKKQENSAKDDTTKTCAQLLAIEETSGMTEHINEIMELRAKLADDADNANKVYSSMKAAAKEEMSRTAQARQKEYNETLESNNSRMKSLISENMEVADKYNEYK